MPVTLLTPGDVEERIGRYLKDHLRLEARHKNDQLEIVLRLEYENGDKEEICSDFIDYSDVVRVVKDGLN